MWIKRDLPSVTWWSNNNEVKMMIRSQQFKVFNQKLSVCEREDDSIIENLNRQFQFIPDMHSKRTWISFSLFHSLAFIVNFFTVSISWNFVRSHFSQSHDKTTIWRSSRKSSIKFYHKLPGFTQHSRIYPRFGTTIMKLATLKNLFHSRFCLIMQHTVDF